MDKVTFEYTNWKGEIRTRVVFPYNIWFGETEYHKGLQWFLHALDVEKGESRDFAMMDITGWRQYDKYSTDGLP